MIKESEVKVIVRKVYPGKSMRAYVSIIIADELALHDIKVIYPQDKEMFLAMPGSFDKNGISRNIYHPMKPELRQLFTSKVAEALATVEADEQANT